jgi:hypothetical protein
MNRFKPILLMCSLAIAALLLFAVKAMAAVTTNIDIPLSGTIVNPCNGENVTFTGVDHFTAHVTFDSSGGFHADFHDNIHVTGTGDQGNSYEGNQEDNGPINISGHGAEEETEPLSFSEIAKGSAPNFVEHVLLHITFNANGTVTAFVDNFTASCRG